MNERSAAAAKVNALVGNRSLALWGSIREELGTRGIVPGKFGNESLALCAPIPKEMLFDSKFHSCELSKKREISDRKLRGWRQYKLAQPHMT